MRKPNPLDMRGELTDAAELTRRYNREFFAEQRLGALASARVVAPIVVELVRPRSVIDIGPGLLPSANLGSNAFAESTAITLIEMSCS